MAMWAMRAMGSSSMRSVRSRPRRPARNWGERREGRPKRSPEPYVVPHARSDQATGMADLPGAGPGRPPHVPQRLEAAVGSAPAEGRRAGRPEPEQVLVSVVALDENAPDLSLTLHGASRLRLDGVRTGRDDTRFEGREGGA